MKIVYCWKCKEHLPMLEDGEHERYMEVHIACLKAIQEYRSRHGVALSAVPLEELRAPAYEMYASLTGSRPAPGSFDHLRKHKATAFGAPCDNCGKNLRTPRARFCAACGPRV